jgi:uncharacterized protein (DUF2384 family)
MEFKATDLTNRTTEAQFAGAIRNLANYRKLVDRLVDVFGDEIKASKWLSLPNPELNGEIPLRIAQRFGYDAQVLDRVFEPILTRIEHGIDF